MILGRKRQHRREGQLQSWPAEIFTQVSRRCVKRPVAEQLSRVEKILRIEGTLDLAHHLEQPGSELFAHVFGARNAHAVLGGERAFELPNERGDFVRHLPEFFQVGRGMQIEHRPDVQEPAAAWP